MSFTVTLSVNEAPPMNAYVAKPNGDGPFPAVMVFQEAFGVNQNIRTVADRMAAEGYFAIAPELFHRTAPAGFESGYGDFSLVKPHLEALTTEKLIDDIQAVYVWLLTQQEVKKDKIGCIGFCVGGKVAFIANSLVPMAACVSFYGGGTHTIASRAATLGAPHLFFWGGKDQHIKQEHIAAITAAMVQEDKDFINVTISYADHGFFNNDRPAYHAAAAAEAWGMIKEFFRTKLN